MNPRPSFFAELQRRHVYKVGAMYAVAGWLLVQVVTQVFPIFNVSALAQRIIVLMVVAGFPAALVLAWLFDLTPNGIVRTGELPEGVDTPASITQRRGVDRKLNYVLGILLLLGGAYVVLDHTLLRGRTPSTVAAVGDEKSIAVLPFENLSGDPTNAYFAEGMQDEILTRLSKIHTLKVISRTSTEKYKSRPDNLKTVAAELGVSTLLEGSVQKAGDAVRVNVQLISALSDTHLWAETYDRRLTDVFSVESEIATGIADSLRATLTGAEERALASRPTDDPEAYQLYLKGKYFWNKRTTSDLHKAADFFNQAIAKDPKYAQAYAALAQTLMVLPAYNGGAPKDYFPQAETAARRALALDDNSVDAHVALASLKSTYNFDSLGAIPEYERALQLDPNDATAHHWLANDTLANFGQSRREVAEMQRAVELDPFSLVINANLGVAYLHDGRLDDAISQLRKTIELDGNFYYGRWNLGVALEVAGKIPEAIAQFQKAVAISDDPLPRALLAQIYGTTGRTQEARKLLDQLLQLRAKQYVNAYELAVAWLGLGNKDEAIRWLELGYQERDGYDLGPIRVDPVLRALHGDPRFEALAEKIVPAKDFSTHAGAE